MEFLDLFNGDVLHKWRADINSWQLLLGTRPQDDVLVSAVNLTSLELGSKLDTL